MDNLFAGRNGFLWFFGTVEDFGDPRGHGRARVRIVGHHNPDKSQLPTAALPWSIVIFPADYGAVGGVGKSPSGLNIGSRVFGFFLDGERREQPVVLGVMFGDSISIPTDAFNPESSPPLPAIDATTPVLTENDTTDAFEQINPNEVFDLQKKYDIPSAKGDFIVPTTGFVASPYGRRGSEFHCGVDICPAGFYAQSDAGADHLKGLLLGPVGNPVVAAADGEVIHLFHSNIGLRGASTTYDLNQGGTRSFGNAIILKHSTPSLGDCLTIYAHLGSSQDPKNDYGTSNGVLVAIGDKVSKGQKIGTIGRTHCWDCPTHLHFEIRRGTALPVANNHINPGLIFPQMYAKHSTYLSWMLGKKYNVSPAFDPAKAPVKQGDGPANS